jgi:DNA-binding winged helix-turn-helix (wHTH) protein
LTEDARDLPFRRTARSIPAAIELRRTGEPVALEPNWLYVLPHPVRARHRLVSKQELLDAVWSGVHVTESTVTCAVSLARAALGDSVQDPRVIDTVASRGYLEGTRRSGRADRRESPAEGPGAHCYRELPDRAGATTR